jgi:hypothetical protein
MKSRNLMVDECKNIKKFRIQHFFYEDLMDNIVFKVASYNSITESCR